MDDEPVEIHFCCPRCGRRMSILATADAGPAWCRTCRATIPVETEAAALSWIMPRARARRQRETTVHLSRRAWHGGSVRLSEM